MDIWLSFLTGAAGAATAAVTRMPCRRGSEPPDSLPPPLYHRRRGGWQPPAMPAAANPRELTSLTISANSFIIKMQENVLDYFSAGTT